MKSSVAANAVSEYKGDPEIMDKIRRWVEETFKERIEELNEEHRKKMNAQKEEYENKLRTQKDEDEEKIDPMTCNLISIGMDEESISEIAKSL